MNTSLRIALLAEACSAGVGRHVVDLAEAFCSTGHDVHVLYSKARMDETFSKHLTKLVKVGARSTEIEIGHVLQMSDFRALSAIRQYLIENGPFDVLHCHSTKAGLVGRTAAVGLNVASVYTPHAFLTMSPIARRSLRLGSGLMELGLSTFSDAIICVSKEEIEHASTLGLQRHKLFLVHNGIDSSAIANVREDRATVRASFGLAENDLCIGFLGRLHPQKSPDLLIQAFAKAEQELASSARLVLVGDGPMTEILRALITRYGLQTRIKLAGKMDGLTALVAFDLLALPSCYEGFPYVVLEAMAVGLPIIATAVGGISALVNKSNGYVVPIGAVDQMASALVHLSLHKGLRQSMAAASKFLSTAYTLTKMSHETLGVYRAVLKGRSPQFLSASRNENSSHRI